MQRRRPILMRVAMAVIPTLLVATAAVIPHVAYAGNATENQIWSRHTGFYLIGVPGGSKTPGTQLETWVSNGHPDQYWRFDYTYFGNQQIINRNSSQCMGVAGGSKSQGAAVVQYTCNGHADQYWQLGGPDGSYGYDTLINVNSGLCVGIQGNSNSQGAKLVQWACDGNSDKQWLPDSALWPGGDDQGNAWLACIASASTDTCSNSDSDPINVVFNDPNRGALEDISNDLATKGWVATNCYNPLVRFDAGQGQLYSPSNVLVTDGSNNGCGQVGAVRDHVRMWVTNDDHTVYMAVSYERTNNDCWSFPPFFCTHTVTDFNGGRNRLYNDEVSRLTGRANFLANSALRQSSGTLQSVYYDGWADIFDIGA